MKRSIAIAVCVLFSLPLVASAQSSQIEQTIGEDGSFTQTESGTSPTGDAYKFQRQGIFDCNRNGSYSMSVGAFSAIGGAYVPVADAAVELNTGTLVYKECVLREVVNRESESALTAFFKKADLAIQTGRNGNPLYVVNEGKELLDVSDQAFLNFLRGPASSKLNPALRDPVIRAAAQYYYGERQPTQATSLECPYQNDLSQWWSGQAPFTFTDFWNASQPQCDAVIALGLYQDVGQARYVNPALQYQNDQWSWANGFYSPIDSEGNIVTPGIVIQQSFQKLLDSSVTKLENANDIGQMIGALYAGVTTQIISDGQGLTGLSRSVGGQPSYLDQVVTESAVGVRNAAANVALNVLAAAQQVEQAYFQAVNSIVSTLTQTIGQLRTAENQCWALIIPKVCTSAVSSANTCQSTNGLTLKIATSTVFSQTVIDAQITPLATTSVANLKASQNALKLIADLIAGVTNTTSLNAQRVSLQQLDSLVAQRKLHTQGDLQTATQQQSSIKDTLETLVQDTVQVWADGTPNGSAFSSSNTTGWCNVNDQTTLSAWILKWKQ